MTKIDERKNKARIDDYKYRLKALGIDAQNKDLEQKLLLLPNDELNRFFSDILKGDKSEIMTTLSRLNINAIDIKKQSSELKSEVIKNLNLKDVTEFKSNGLNYFKFKDDNGNIFVVKNLGNDSRELFMDILNHTKIANSQDGKQNTAEIFKFLRDKKFIEVNLTNSKDVEVEKHTKEQMAVLKEIEKHFPNKEVKTSFDENMFIVKGMLAEEDIILSVHKQNGKYKVEQIKELTYGSKENNKLESTENQKVEIPNEVLIELENDEELAKDIEKGLNEGLSDEQIEKGLHGVEERHSKIPNLREAIRKIITKKREEKRNGQTNNLGGRQYVLTRQESRPTGETA